MAEKLEDYNKRDFDKTGEPEGQIEESRVSEDVTSESLRFVVQHHMARNAHYDFRLEWKGVLLLGSAQGPSYNTRDKGWLFGLRIIPWTIEISKGRYRKANMAGHGDDLGRGVWEPYGTLKKASVTAC